MGNGMKFPPQVNPVTGRFVEASIEESVRDSVYLILMTQKKERIPSPDFGSTLLSYTFADTTPTVLHMMAHDLEEAVLSQEPRIVDLDIQIEERRTGGILDINVRYTFSEGRCEELTVPFYRSGS